jgi:hypothetical protein
VVDSSSRYGRAGPGADEEHTAVAGLPAVQRYSAVLWPSFLFAAAATVVFFALIDPVSMFDCQGAAPLGRTAAYSLGFFLFWLLTAGSSAATYYFLGTRVPPRKQVEEPDLD